jgi:hypothetical protein
LKILLIIPVILILLMVYILLPEVDKSGLRPNGGSRLKNRLAELMIRKGASDHRSISDYSQVDVRIPPSASQSAEDYNDSFVFQGFNAEQEVGYLTRLGFRDDGELTEVWFWLDIKGKIYHNAEQFFDNSPADKSGLSKGGVGYRVLDEGEYEITWNGKCEPDNEDIEVKFIFKADSPHYLMSEHRDPRGYGMAMAEMKWSREYFERLRGEGADRYERGGITSGTVKVGTGKALDVSLKGFRDRSWGKRNWLYINRYIWNLVSLKEDLVIDGKTYNYIIYTTVNYGDTFSHLVSGWAGGKDGIRAISYASDMTKLGEDCIVPKNYETSFRLMDSDEIITLQVIAREGSHSWFVADGQFEVNETFAEFEVKGRGIKGEGMQEFGYSLQAYTERRNRNL